MGINSTVDLMAGNLLQEGVHGTGRSRTDFRTGLVGADGLIMNTQLTGVKIRGFLGDYCIRTRCPSIKTRHVKLLFIYSTFCSMLCVLTLSYR